MSVVVRMGTGGWSDESIRTCGRFYPKNIGNRAVNRLRFYSRHFSCVEIDTSTYAIPRQSQVIEWSKVTPDGFKFNIKAFGLFCNSSIPTNALPRDLRAIHLTTETLQHQNIKLKEMPSSLIDALWKRFNDVCQILYEKQKLGVVVFQFHRDFRPSLENCKYLHEIRQRLNANFSMCIEFRQRDWLNPFKQCTFFDRLAQLPSGTLLKSQAMNEATKPAIIENIIYSETMPNTHLNCPKFNNKAVTITLLRQLNIALVASDDLEHEMSSRETQLYMTGKLPWRHLPIHTDVTAEGYTYVRIHRRQGTERLLADDELTVWQTHIKKMAETLKCQISDSTRTPSGGNPEEESALVSSIQTAQRYPRTIFITWQTDFEDQPVINAKQLSVRLPELEFGWKEAVRKFDAQTGIRGMFARANQSTSKSTDMDDVSNVANQSATTSLNKNEELDVNAKDRQDRKDKGRSRGVDTFNIDNKRNDTESDHNMTLSSKPPNVMISGNDIDLRQQTSAESANETQPTTRQSYSKNIEEETGVLNDHISTTNTPDTVALLSDTDSADEIPQSKKMPHKTETTQSNTRDKIKRESSSSLPTKKPKQAKLAAFFGQK